ncbi:hypothetical protein D3C87_2121120 [compost metagenome]
MQAEANLTVEDFTQLLQAMKKSHEKLVIDRQASWEHRLDILGSFLSKEDHRGTPLEEEEQ